MSLGSRLEELRGSIPIADFAQSFGIHKNTYSNYVKQLNVPDCKFILCVCQKFGISPNWLLLGVGPKYLDEQLIRGSSIEFESQEHLLLPLIETWVIGREGEITHDGILEYVPVKRKWLEKSVPDLSEDRLRSPSPDAGAHGLHDSDRNYRRPDPPRYRTNGAGTIRRKERSSWCDCPDGERALKRVTLANEPGGCKVLLFSDNTLAYKMSHFTLASAAELHRFILGRVLWLFREL